MQTLSAALASLNFEVELDDDEMIADAVVIARCTRMSDGRTTVTFAKTDGADIVTVLGLLESGRQIQTGEWDEADGDGL